MKTARTSQADAGSAILRTVLDSDGMSRAEISRATGIRSNTAGELVDQMVEEGLLRETGRLTPARDSRREGRGRPAIRVEADPTRRHVVGLALRPRHVEGVRLNLLGETAGHLIDKEVPTSDAVGRVAGSVAKRLIDVKTLAVGVSSTGFVDEGDMKLLFSSSAPTSPGLSLGPVLSAVGDLPIALENDVHALGDRWRLSHPDAARDTTLLIRLGDGAIGASLMAGGAPADAGCVRGGNELGHVQFKTPGVGVPPCYCGQQNCLERIFSSPMIESLTGRRQRLCSLLRERLEAPDGLFEQITDPGFVAPPEDPSGYLLTALIESVANIVNFTRPHRIVWTAAPPLRKHLHRLEPALSRGVTARLIGTLQSRVAFNFWAPQTPSSDAAIGAHLALAMLTGRRRTANAS